MLNRDARSVPDAKSPIPPQLFTVSGFAGGEPATQTYDDGVRVAFFDFDGTLREEIERAELHERLERTGERLTNIMATIPGVVWETWGEPDVVTQKTDFISVAVNATFIRSLDVPGASLEGYLYPDTYRYRPRENEAVNKSWMCDQGRLSYKYLNKERALHASIGRVYTPDDGPPEGPAKGERVFEIVPSQQPGVQDVVGSNRIGLEAKLADVVL